MNQPDMVEKGQRQFALVYRNSKEVLDADDDPQRKLILIHLGRTRAVDSVCDEARNIEDIPCSAGCSMCCHQNVHISSSEACIIALYLMTENPEHGDISKTAKRLAHIPTAEQYTRGIACPFLVNRRCSIYSARPIVCRGHLSLSLERCRLSWKTRRSRDAFNIPTVFETQYVGVLSGGASDLAMSHAGWQFETGELSAMVERALRPGAIADWLNGEKVFPAGRNTKKIESNNQKLFEIVKAAGYLELGRTPGVLKD